MIPAMNGLTKALCAWLFFTWASQAVGQRPHQHGSFDLNLVLEEKTLLIELVVPLVNIAGFEHWPPQSEEQQQWLDSGLGVLKDSRSIFVFPQEAKCKIKDVSVELPEASQASSSGVVSDEIMALQPEAEEPLGALESHEDHQVETHLDLVVNYEFKCKRVDRFDSFRVQVFRLFPKLEQGKAFVLTADAQRFQDIDIGSPVVRVSR